FVGHFCERPVSFDNPLRSGPCHCGQSCVAAWVAPIPIANTSVESDRSVIRRPRRCLAPVRQRDRCSGAWHRLYNSSMFKTSFTRTLVVNSALVGLVSTLGLPARAAAQPTIRTTLPPITVTAQKEPEDPQNLPLSVTTVLGETWT